MMSALLSFKAQNEQISINGIGTCPDWPDTETVQYMFEQ
jgi:hypothetical protein